MRSSTKAALSIWHPGRSGFSFDPSNSTFRCHDFPGGEQARLLIAQLMLQPQTYSFWTNRPTIWIFQRWMCWR